MTWTPQHTWLTVKIALAGGAIVIAAAGWVTLKDALQRYVSDEHRHVVTAEDVTLVDVPPAWQNKGTLKRLRSRVADRVQPNPLDQQSLTGAVRALEADPIVQSAQIKRGQAGRLRVNASFLLPAAIVEARDGFHLVDQKGTRLTLRPYHANELTRGRLKRLPVIRWINSAPPRDAGQRWQGKEVQASLALIDLLRRKLRGELFKQVEAIDASARDSRGRVRLAILTRRGLIEWGSAPGQTHVSEVRAPVKLQRLRRLASRHHGQIDAGGRHVAIDGPSMDFRGAAEVRNAQRQ